MKKLMIKKILFSVCIALLSTLLIGCIEFDPTADDLAEEIAHIIERKDEQAMRDFFAKEAFDEITEEDFQKGLDYAFSLMKGEVVEVKNAGSGGGSESIGGRIQYKTTYGCYQVITTESKYYLDFDYVYHYSRSDNAKGSYRIVFSEFQELATWGKLLQRNYYFGIYHPGWENRPKSEEIGFYELMEKKYIFPTDFDKSRWVAQEVDFYFDVNNEFRKDRKNFNTRGILKTKERKMFIILGIWPRGEMRVDEVVGIRRVEDTIRGGMKNEYDIDYEILEGNMFDSNEDSFKLKIDEEYQYVFGDEPIKEITFIREEIPADDQSEALDIPIIE